MQTTQAMVRARHPFTWPTLLLVALNLFDALATLRILALGAYETNPMTAAVLDRGWLVFVAVKVLWPLALAYGLLRLDRAGSRIAWPGLHLCCLAYLCLAVYHLTLW